MTRKMKFSLPEKNIIRKPGKVSAQTITLNLSAPANAKDSNTAKIQKKRIKKDSSQLLNTFYTVKYITPYISPAFIRDVYESNPFHMRCIKFKANCIVGSGCDIVTASATDKLDPSDSEFIKYNNFITNPVNDYGEYFIQVLRSMCDDYEGFGHCALEVVINNNHEISEIYNFPAYEMRVAYDQNAPEKWSDKIKIIQITNQSFDREFRLLTEESFKTPGSYIFWHKNSNPFNRFYGFPEWYSATPKLVLDKAIDEYNLKLFKNDLLISFAIIVEGGEIDSEGLGKIKDFMEANYKGLSNANRALYLNSDAPDVKIRIEKIQKDGREASFLLTQDRCRDAVIVAHGVVASLLGISTPGKLGSTSENYDLFRVFNYSMIKPEQNILADKLSWLFKIGLGISKYNLELKELSFEKLSESIAYATQLTQTGIIDTNEARQSLDYEPRTEDNSVENQINNLAKQVKLLKSKFE